MSDKTVKSLFCWVPRVIALAFIVFISIFSLDVFSEYSGFDLIFALFVHLVPSLVLLLIVFLAWKNELVGGVIFLCASLAYIVAVGLDRHWSWYVGISGPLLLLSILFFMSYFARKKYKPKRK